MKTRSEELLTFLAKRSFLSLWAYPNLFRPSENPRVPAAEVGDVIAVFGNDVVVFSDKHCDYPKGPDDLLSWKRWYRRAISRSADQLLGAKRYLLNPMPALFHDQACIDPLQVPLPPIGRRRIHLVAVARGAAEACREAVGGHGFLMVTNSVVSDSDPQLFTLCQPSKGSFVHVIDEVALSFLMSHLDTAQDIIDYLSARESYLRRPYGIFYQGEHDLFLSYLAGSEDLGKPRQFPEDRGLREGDEFHQMSHWDEFEAHEKYRIWREESKNSDQWDRMVEHFISDLQSGHFLREGATYGEAEEMIRAFAKTNRLERRQLMDFARSAGTDPSIGNNGKIRRTFTVGRDGVTGYLLLCVDPWPGEAEEAFMERRHAMGESYAFVLKIRRPELQLIASLAFPSEKVSPFTWAAGLIDVSILTSEQRELGLELLSKGVFATDPTVAEITEFDQNPVITIPPVSQGW